MYKFGPREDISLDTAVPEAPPRIIIPSIPSDVPVYPPGGLYPASDPIVTPRAVPQIIGATNVPDLQGYADAGNSWPMYSSALPVVSGVGASRSEELIVRMLCPSDKIGRVIGKGGSTIKSMRQASGARIEVDDSKANYDECLIIITTTEVQYLSLLHFFSYNIKLLIQKLMVLHLMEFMMYPSACLISLDILLLESI